MQGPLISLIDVWLLFRMLQTLAPRPALLQRLRCWPTVLSWERSLQTHACQPWSSSYRFVPDCRVGLSCHCGRLACVCDLASALHPQCAGKLAAVTLRASGTGACSSQPPQLSCAGAESAGTAASTVFAHHILSYHWFVEGGIASGISKDRCRAAPCQALGALS